MQMHQKIARRLKCRILSPILAFRCHKIAHNYVIAHDWKRIYHYHIRKTAGTSLNTAFLSIIGADLQDIAHKNMLMRNDIIFVQHDKKLIERGDYFYGSSHIAAHKLVVPEKTFTITILRDPLERVISYYRHLMFVRDDPRASRLEPAFWRLRRETEWLGSSFGEFVSRMPRARLLNQLYMFSASFSVAEAAERIVACSYVGFTSSFAAHISDLADILDLPLKLSWERRFGEKTSPPPEELAFARTLLKPEYDLLHRVKPRLGYVGTHYAATG